MSFADTLSTGWEKVCYDVISDGLDLMSKVPVQ